MIFVTGDTHGMIDFDKLKSEELSRLTKSDYVIIAGDCGVAWSQKTLEKNIAEYEKLPFTTLFIDGNHENFDILNKYQVVNRDGGKAHVISPSVIHLMRGQIFTIEDKTFFTFGGAVSTDKHYRKEGVSWWKEEEPDETEYDEAVANLEKVNYKVDYIITHTIDERAFYYYPMNSYGFHIYHISRRLNYFEETVQYKHWYFGHYHLNAVLNDKKTALYDSIVKL